MVEKTIWSKKLNKPLNKMHMRKQSFGAKTMAEGVKRAKVAYSKAKHLSASITKNPPYAGKKYFVTVRAYY